MDKQSYVYILASQRYGTLYIGVTKQYNVKQLVWYEVHGDIMAAITREKQLKKWERKWKTQLVSRANPLWRDLYDDICGV